MDPGFLRTLILVAVFGAVLLIVDTSVRLLQASRRHSTAINKRMDLIARGFSRERVLAHLRRDTQSNLPGILGVIVTRLETGLLGAGLRIRASTLLLYLLIAALAVFTFACIIIYNMGIALTFPRLMLVATFAAALGFGLPFVVLSRIADRRRKKLEQQFPVALDVFVRGLRAGHPISAALELLTHEMQDPIGSEFGLVVDEAVEDPAQVVAGAALGADPR